MKTKLNFKLDDTDGVIYYKDDASLSYIEVARFSDFVQEIEQKMVKHSDIDPEIDLSVGSDEYNQLVSAAIFDRLGYIFKNLEWKVKE